MSVEDIPADAILEVVEVGHILAVPDRPRPLAEGHQRRRDDGHSALRHEAMGERTVDGDPSASMSWPDGRRSDTTVENPVTCSKPWMTPTSSTNGRPEFQLRDVDIWTAQISWPAVSHGRRWPDVYCSIPRRWATGLPSLRYSGREPVEVAPRWAVTPPHLRIRPQVRWCRRGDSTHSPIILRGALLLV